MTTRPQSQPVTKDQLLAILDLLASRIEAIFDEGMVLENADDYEMEKTRMKIAAKQDEIRRLRQLLTKTRGIISRRRELEKERQRK